MAASQHFVFPNLRTVAASRPFSWIAAGAADFGANPPASLFYGACFAGMGWVLNLVFNNAVQYTSGLTMGFLLVGPLLAIGLYDLSRQRESGVNPTLAHSIVAWRSNIGAIGIYVLIVTVLFLLWARASLVAFALFYTQDMPTMAGFLKQVVSLENYEFLVAYFAVGLIFATLVFAISVVSIPYLLDAQVDAVTAAAASVVALARNPKAMMVWAGLIVTSTFIGFETAYLGLAITVPLVGHASWHAYRELVEHVAPVAGTPGE